MWGLGRFVLIVAALALAGVAAWQYATRWHPSVERYPVQGVDVDASDGAIEWNNVAAAGADFAYVVATRGANQRDPAFEANWRGVDAAGMRRGAVHVYSFCQPAREQANAFNTFVPSDADALPVAIDISYDPGCATRPERAALLDDLRLLASTIEAHMGKPVLLRVARAVESDYEVSAALPRNLWATGNFIAPSYAARPWRLWRANDMRRVDGIDGPANWDVAAP
ncbi:glycosyl hydrolase [Sphingomonas sp. CL5.1]|uniref:GH25 family lysozyme n=1 Tax=Sphingomonas sp. CL5.1 TaxID=2653203 RepID=UPI0015841343|nr:GH25 family lysozyme [Sphingomonas sp. CL5.1]QKR99616.1 glycosyl hydrolase [Sphingomonas sp. CL5.1]